MSSVPRTIEEAQGLLRSWPMNERGPSAVVLGMFAVAACGQVDFGTDRIPVDAAVLDIGIDVGVDDTGVEPDAGIDAGNVEPECLLVTLPPSSPAAWPFATDLQAFEDRFLSWAQDENCVACHNLQRYQSADQARPLIVRDSEEQQTFQGDSAWVISRDLVWQTAAASSLRAADAVGPLWRHDRRHPNFRADWEYSPAEVTFLEGFMHQGWACGIPDYLAPQDAGPACGSPPDGGFPDLGFGPDGGSVDTSVPDQGPTDPCYCDDRPDAGVYDPALCVVP